MSKEVVIIGAGITGITAAYLLKTFDPDCSVCLIDAGPGPDLKDGTSLISSHFGATLGNACDARQFTGTEGLSFQNPVHTKLLYLDANEPPGWRTIPEENLTDREKAWRQECVDRCERNVSPTFNPYDDMYSALNYGGMNAWEFLAFLDEALQGFRISTGHVYVAFETEEEFEADFESESRFNPLNSEVESRVFSAERKVLNDHLEGNFAVDQIHEQLLRVPGSAWRIKSIWRYFYSTLKNSSNVEFIWNSPIEELSQLPTAPTYIWAAGTAYALPDIYREHGRVQGIGGWWLSIPNAGFKVPFKISAPQPAGYINFTPDGSSVHICGGFGWVGERPYAESERLLQPCKAHVLSQLSRFLKISKQQLEAFGAGRLHQADDANWTPGREGY